MSCRLTCTIGNFSDIIHVYKLNLVLQKISGVYSQNFVEIFCITNHSLSLKKMEEIFQELIGIQSQSALFTKALETD